MATSFWNGVKKNTSDNIYGIDLRI